MRGPRAEIAPPVADHNAIDACGRDPTTRR